MMRIILIAVAAIAALIVIGVGGMYMSLRRGDIPMETLQARYGAANSQYMDMGDGVTLHYRDDGAGTVATVLLLHGYGASSATWDAWTLRLKDKYRLVRVDLPGHGLTTTPEGYVPTLDGYADLVDAFAGKLGLGPVAVVGSSMGGNVAWRLAERHPERVGALVLVGSAGWRDEGADGGGFFELVRSPFWGPLLRDLDTTRLVRQTLEASFVDQSIVTDAMVARYVELSRAPGRRALLRALTIESFTVDPASPARLAAISAPSLVLHGREDRLVPVSDGERFAAAIADAKLVVFDTVGHIPQEEIPDQSAGELHAFLSALEPYSPIGQPIPLGVSPDGPGAPLPGPGANRAQPPLEGVY